MPTINFITEQFIALTKTVATARGMPDLPVHVFPHGIEHLPEARIRELADGAFGKMVDALTSQKQAAKA
ncbi:MAG: hypothetical protein HYX92_22555 [Chloroflexi bacterium]|nr:hypothetical protein [Chloroflexota bacterium]